MTSNVLPVDEVSRMDIKIHQVVIGCCEGRIEDLRLAAEVLRDRKVHPGVRLLIVPATQEIQLQAVQEGLAALFMKAGGCFCHPTCGPCRGDHHGILANGERAVATTPSNAIGCMGSPRSKIYLVNPAVAAASAVMGRIASPDELERVAA